MGAQWLPQPKHESLQCLTQNEDYQSAGVFINKVVNAKKLHRLTPESRVGGRASSLVSWESKKAHQIRMPSKCKFVSQTASLISPIAQRCTLGAVQELVQVESLAQVGVQLLLFTLGLEFSLSKLRAVRSVALVGGVMQILLTMVLAGGLASAIGASIHEGVFIGALVRILFTCLYVLSSPQYEDTGVHGVLYSSVD